MEGDSLEGVNDDSVFFIEDDVGSGTPILVVQSNQAGGVGSDGTNDNTLGTNELVNVGFVGSNRNSAFDKATTVGNIDKRKKSAKDESELIALEKNTSGAANNKNSTDENEIEAGGDTNNKLGKDKGESKKDKGLRNYFHIIRGL